jgi:hypothetical protein
MTDDIPPSRDIGLAVLVAAGAIVSTASFLGSAESSPPPSKLVTKPVQFLAQADDGSPMLIRRVDLPADHRSLIGHRSAKTG